MKSPFDLDDQESYRRWRDARMQPSTSELLPPVEIADPNAVAAVEGDAVLARCRRHNMALYRLAGGEAMDKAALRRFAAAFGLRRLDSNLCADDDGISALQVRADGGRGAGDYIPYSDKPINWHTDGYYNSPERRIRGMVLHCVEDAAEGGENALLDPEIAYILLRDEDPGLIRALQRDDAMTIPANVVDGVELRPAVTGPVFSLVDGFLHMRYTARGRNVVWADDATLTAARQRLTALLADPANPHVVRYRLQPGEGLICNNVLHNRSGFSDGGSHNRLLWRARFHDRIEE